jgi:diguanylate cyclase (GGDEF)-like protein
VKQTFAQINPVNKLTLPTIAEEIALLKAAVIGAHTVVFDWTLADDSVVWEGALDILPCTIDRLDTGKTFLDMMPPPSQELLTAKLERTTPASSAFKIEVEMASPLGSVWYDVSVTRIAGENGVNGHVVGLMAEITERRSQMQRLEYLASRDELTGLLNRNSLRGALNETIERVKGENRHCALLVASIDWLGMINDTYGFDAADEVIVEVGQRLQHTLRSSDVIGRMAGNKFGIILKNCGDFEVPVVADRLRCVVRGGLIETRSGEVAATCSVGAVWLPQGASSSQEAMLRAEEALIHARRHGRDSYFMFQPSPQREGVRLRLMAMADEVLQALKQHRLVFAYQPIFDARTRKAVEYECLLRMVREDGSIVSAGQFIPATEQLGLVRLIDWHALEMVVEQLETIPSICLGVNVSGTTACDASWLQSFVNYVDLHSGIAKRLVVELTETAALNNFEENARFVSQLRELGCRVAIDDFGAGYTSFRNLQKMQVDVVKIDGTYIAGLVNSPQNQIFVRTLVDLAKSIHLKTTAEWVSNEEEAQLLEKFGVDNFQGFFLGEPELEPNWQR